jgi:hypothetical protein
MAGCLERSWSLSTSFRKCQGSFGDWERKKSFKMRLALHPVLRWRFTRGYGSWPC